MSRREYPVPHVERIRTDSGTSPHPPFSQSWSDGQQLAWSAGCVMAETNLTIHVYDADQKTRRGNGPWRTVPGLYSFTIQGPGISGGTSGMDFQSAWSWLNGVRIGAQAAQPRKEIER